MKFGESIDSVLFKNYFNLEGRATRSEFWWFMLFFLIFNLIVGVVVGIFYSGESTISNISSLAK